MKKVILSLLAVCFVSACAPEAFACSCAGFSVRQKFREADAVFLGRVAEMTPFGPTEDFPMAMYLVRFEVEKRWRGDVGRGVTAVADVDMPVMCGDLNLAVGESYLIYAPREKGRLRVLTDCGPNLNAKYADEEMKRLGGFWLRARARLYPYPKL
ncbi:MAG: hypothetical protein LC795_03085 [Acidobacteria bacterium]|nr:hypothetical protein [Acidobacteriota bacterium]